MTEYNKSKQLYITSFDYPLNSVKNLFFKRQTFDLLYKKKECNVKMFIGSDWSIIGSGLIFYGPNDLKIVYTISKIEKHDFEYTIKYLVTHINNQKSDKNIELVLSLISNTSNNTTIIEYKFEYRKDTDYDYIKSMLDISLIQKILNQFCFDADHLFKSFNKENLNNKESLILNHSFIIHKNYKEAFNFFYNQENIAKSIKTDNIWEINKEKDPDNDYINFSVKINKNIKINYKVVSITEDKNKILIIYDKTANSFPALNAYIKLEFIYLANDICFFMYETHLPININSSLFNTISNYIYYCNHKSKVFFETHAKNINNKII